MIDDTDAKILNILGRDARLPNVEIARQVGMAPSAVLERIRKLEKTGIVQGYVPWLNPQAVGLGLLAFIFIRTDERVGVGRTASLLAKVRQVQEVHHIAGEDCYLVKVRAADTEDLGRLLRDDFGRIKAIRSTRTTIVLETIKETAILPVTAQEKRK